MILAAAVGSAEISGGGFIFNTQLFFFCAIESVQGPTRLYCSESKAGKNSAYNRQQEPLQIDEKTRVVFRVLFGETEK